MRLETIARRPLACRRLAVLDLTAEILAGIKDTYSDAELELAVGRSSRVADTLLELDKYQDFDLMAESAWSEVFPEDEYDLDNEVIAEAIGAAFSSLWFVYVVKETA